jgi:hypothetical protein
MLSRSLLSVVALTVACGGGLKLKLVNQSAAKPSNVAVYFAVDTSSGEPVPGLTADKFIIYEDGQKVSEFESKQTILNPTVAAAHYTLLLVDMSGSIVESKNAPKVVDAAAKFTAKVGKSHKVGVAAFDGSTELTGVVPFTESGAAAQSGLDKLATFKPKDPSTNLHGAVVEGLKTLRKALDAEPKPLKFGTLVVFTDGSDRANRVSREDMKKAMADDKHKDFDIYAIGVGPEQEMKGSKLDEIGRTQTVYESDPQKTDQAFDKIATKIEGMTQRYYLLSYCTPSRAGEHEVEIEAKTDKGSGSLKYKFKADGFGPNCDPNTPPPFDLTHPVDPTPTSTSGGSGSASGSVKVEKK